MSVTQLSAMGKIMELYNDVRPRMRRRQQVMDEAQWLFWADAPTVHNASCRAVDFEMQLFGERVFKVLVEDELNDRRRTP